MNCLVMTLPADVTSLPWCTGLH